MTKTAEHPEKMEFKTELKQLLHLITHSLYSNKEIFLRELISNASDAINKIKFDSLQHEDKLEGDKDWKIKIRLDRDAGTLTVSDNGVGLSRDDAVANLGTIAKSGTRAFLESLQGRDAKAKPELIGQFGVGFYSAFMVADKVTVLSRPAGDPDQGVRWESDGQGDFTVETAHKDRRGTDVILHLKPEEKEFLDPYTVRQIVKKFSNFIEHPVVMDVEKEDKGGKKTVAEETLNSRKALWLRSKSEATPEEYAEFYKQIANDTEGPARVIHYTAEGAHEFRVLAFIPSHRPMELMWGDYKAGLRLYVQRVLIMEHCEELLPPYLRFVRGVVDSSDLPLNISREMLQHNPLLEQIRNNVVRTVLKELGRHEDARLREVRRLLQGTRGDPQGGRRPRLEQPRPDRRPAAVRVAEDAGRPTHHAGEIRRIDAGGTKGHLLSDWGRPRAGRTLAAPGGVPRQGLGRAAADRPHRRVRHPEPAGVQGQEAPGGRPRRDRGR